MFLCNLSLNDVVKDWLMICSTVALVINMVLTTLKLVWRFIGSSRMAKAFRGFLQEDIIDLD